MCLMWACLAVGMTVEMLTMSAGCGADDDGGGECGADVDGGGVCGADVDGGGVCGAGAGGQDPEAAEGGQGQHPGR